MVELRDVMLVFTILRLLIILIIIGSGGGGSSYISGLENASTIDGRNSMPSISGGTETGHSGNGYARITLVE